MYTKKISLYLWVIAGLIGFIIFFFAYDKVFPSASIDLKISRPEALAKAEDLIKQFGFDVSTYDSAVRFSSVDLTAIYIQKQIGIKAANNLIRDHIPVWYWRVRFFKELDKEEYVLGLDPSDGELVFWRHSILEEGAGDNLTLAQARKKAEEFILGQGLKLSDYILRNQDSHVKAARTDHSFEWEHSSFSVGEGVLRVRVGIQGSEFGGYSRYLKIPERFSRELTKETSWGLIMAKLSHMLTFLFLIIAVFFLIRRVKIAKVSWKGGCIFAIIFIVLRLISFVNQFPLIWNSYAATISKPMFLMMGLERLFSSSLADGLMIFSFFTLGKIYFDRIDSKIKYSNVIVTVLRSLSLSGIFLGYATSFYLIAKTFVPNFWVPLNSGYSDVIGTLVPCIAPFIVGIVSSLDEEIIYRFLGISFFTYMTKRRVLSIFIMAVFWGLAHSTYQIYPMYLRGIELTIFGTLLGFVFLRYGITTVIISHFYINTILNFMPLLRSGNSLNIVAFLLFLISGPIIFHVCSRVGLTAIVQGREIIT